MKTHFFKVINRRAAVVTTTLCGRMSKHSRDGTNSTSDAASVTCLFCLSALASAQGRSAMQDTMIEQAKSGIVYHARECEDALRLAVFSGSDPIMLQHDGAGIAGGLNKLAIYHADHAWRWVAALRRATET